MVISSGSRNPLKGQGAVYWWVRDNPAPRARAWAQVAALATRGTNTWYIPMSQGKTNSTLSPSDHYSSNVFKNKSIIGQLEALMVILSYDLADIQILYLQSLGGNISGQIWISSLK